MPRADDARLVDEAFALRDAGERSALPPSAPRALGIEGNGHERLRTVSCRGRRQPRL
jgi:hypothetical protein